MAIMTPAVPVLEHVRPVSFYESVAGVGPGIATGFEAHCWCIWRGTTNPLNNVVDGGLLANGDGTDGWGISYDYVLATGLTTFSATFGDTGGAAVKITSGSMFGIWGRFALISAFAASDGAIALAVNGDVVASGSLVGAFSPAAGTSLQLGADAFGFTPAIDMSYAGVAYDEAAVADLASIRRNAAIRYQALVQSMRMWKIVAFQGGASGTVEPIEYDNAWDGISLLQSGPKTASALDRNLPSATWLPRSGTDNLTRTGTEADALANLINFSGFTTPWVVGV